MTNRIRYTDSLKGIDASMLDGFFHGWSSRPSPDKHLRILKGSTHVVLAVDEDKQTVIGFINAITDRANSAFIPLLEVLPEYRKCGIGAELVGRMLEILGDYPCVDLCCDPEIQPFYAKLGMKPSVGMLMRDYRKTGPIP